MENFVIWIGSIGALCIGIMVLAVFFKILGIIGSYFSNSKYIKIKKFLNKSGFVTVHLSSGKIITNLKFIGCADWSSLKDYPYEMKNMVVFESVDGKRVLLRASAIRIMEEQEDR
jgi:hypothetical protein